MLKIRVLMRLLGGGAALVCSAGVALGFQGPIGEPEADPTPLNPLICEGVFLPVDGRPIPNWYPNEGCDPSQLFSPHLPPIDLSQVSTESGSWYNPAVPWLRDRRPAKIIQLGSNGYEANSRANPSWWWIKTSGNPYYFDYDLPVDHGSANPNFRHPDSQNPFIPHILPLANEQAIPSGEPDQFEALVREMEFHIVEGGFRRFILHVPAGVLFGRMSDAITPPMSDVPAWNNRVVKIHNQSMNQFRAMPLWKQYYFCGKNVNGGDSSTNVWTRFVNTYCGADPSYDPAHPEKVSIEIYVGSEMSDGACSLGTGQHWGGALVEQHLWVTNVSYNGAGVPFRQYSQFQQWCEPYRHFYNAIPFDPRQQTHMNRLWFEIGPWWAAGARTIWLDAGVENRMDDARLFGTLELSQNASFRSIGMRFGSETVPTDLTARIPIDCAIQKMRWLCTSQVAFINNLDGTRTLKPAFNWSRVTSEVHLWPQSGDLSWNEFGLARNRGFVVDLSHCENDHLMCEIAKRWYSMGIIQVADFNGDSFVDQDDVDDFNYAYLHGTIPSPPPAPAPIIVFASGDINKDGAVTQADVTMFMNAYTTYLASPPTNRPPPLDYGLANDL